MLFNQLRHILQNSLPTKQLTFNIIRKYSAILDECNKQYPVEVCTYIIHKRIQFDFNRISDSPLVFELIDWCAFIIHNVLCN